MKISDRAYLAGLVDGEGTVTISRSHKGRMRSPSLIVASTSYELVLWCKIATGVGNISSKKVYQMHHRKSFHWSVSHDQCLVLLREIFPFMKEKNKLRRVEILLSCWKESTPRNGKYTTEMLEAKSKLILKFFEIDL